jgi:hypothetical protein
MKEGQRNKMARVNIFSILKVVIKCNNNNNNKNGTPSKYFFRPDTLRCQGRATGATSTKFNSMVIGKKKNGNLW